MTALILDQGRVFGARYYTVDPNANWDPFWYRQDWHDMENWCIETFGPTPKDGTWTPEARWYMNNRKFWFREQKDMEWFILRWG